MIHLTPEILSGAYSLLRETPPFRGWKIPEPDGVGFMVSRTPNICGQYWRARDGLPVIAISGAAVGRLDTLIRIMAHEMIHLVQDVKGTANSANHNADFRRKAETVCRYHGFDPKLFV